jgi:tetratricopeptide (TPR) repeat protein
MRTQLIRAAMALAVVLAVAGPAAAQSQIRGKVLSVEGLPVEGATVTMVAVEGQGQAEVTTNGRGEFAQIGLGAGEYNFTVTKDDLTSQMTERLTMARPLELEFVLAPPAGDVLSAEMKELADGAIVAINEGRNVEAIQSFNEVLVNLPNCSDCYYNLGVAYTNEERYDEAVTAFERTVQLAPGNAGGYSGLANIYNIQQKFDLAAEAGARAAELGGGSAGGDNAEALFNQGVILWNAGNFADAKTQFEAAIAVDPTTAMAHYQLGMANLNLGMVPEARQAFEGYLEAAPDGEKAAEVNGFLQQLPQ